MPPYGPAATYSFKSTEVGGVVLEEVPAGDLIDSTRCEATRPAGSRSLERPPGNAVSSDWQGRIFFLAPGLEGCRNAMKERGQQ